MSADRFEYIDVEDILRNFLCSEQTDVELFDWDILAWLKKYYCEKPFHINLAEEANKAYEEMLSRKNSYMFSMRFTKEGILTLFEEAGIKNGKSIGECKDRWKEKGSS